jgi:Bacterial nucleoid DNA-binding protein
MKELMVPLIAEQCEITTEQASRAYDMVWDLITHEVRQGRRVLIRGFGSFWLGTRAAHVTRTPSTGVMITVPERKSIRFSASRQANKKFRVER